MSGNPRPLTMALFALAWGLAPGSSARAASDTLSVAEREDHSPCLAIDPADRPAVIWVATAPDTNASGRFDEVWIAERNASGWLAPEMLAGPGDYFTPEIVWASDGARWTVWVDHDGADSRIVCRRDLGGSSKSFVLDDPSQPDLEPSMCADEAGGVHVAWQGWRKDNYEILVARGDASGFSAPLVVSECGLSDREPEIVRGAGQSWIVWSAYQDGPYNLQCRTFDGSSLSPTVQLTESTGARNLHPSATWDDANGVLWVASLWVNEGWSPFNSPEPGPYDRGSPRVRAYDGATVSEPLGLDSNHRFPLVPMEDLGYLRFDYGNRPMFDRYGTGVDVLATAGNRVWVFYKQLGSLSEFGTDQRYFGVVGQSYADGSWSAPGAFLELRTSFGWEAPVAAASADSMWIAWSSDDRTDPIVGEQQLEMFGRDLNLVVESVPLSAPAAGPPGLASLGAPAAPTPCAAADEPPEFQVSDGGRTYTLLWGDNHRHSMDLSYDSRSDPPIKETIFYSLDFLGHDFLVPSDHAERYSAAVWAMVAKWSELYDVPGHYRVFPGWERAMRRTAGARGDQNAIFRNPADFASGLATYPQYTSWHTMYQAMEGIDVLSVPHTTGQCGVIAADWDHLAAGNPDSLPAPLRVVEVYQSARGSFEYPGCPLQYTGCVAGPDSGWVSVALAMGLRLGLICASDHTARAAYMGVFAEDRSRDAIWNALYDRRCYGTSIASRFDVEFRVGGAFMGSETESAGAPLIEVHVRAAAALSLIEINKDGDPSWFSAASADSDTTFSFIDPDPVVPGTSSFYYLRVQDETLDMTWSSPVWVDFPASVGSPGAPSPPATGLSIRARPNPARGPVRFELGAVGREGGRIRIHDVRGRLVSRIELPPNAGAAVWNGRDRTGNPVAPGVYFAVLQSGGEQRSAKWTVLR